jgi:putative ABC transport system permease protein
VHDVSLDRDQRITVYESFEQSPLSGYNILLRTTGDPVALAAPLRSALRDLSASATLSGVRTLDSLRDRALARPRFFAALLLLFAVTGVMLALVGVYGVLAQLARNRGREIAIRIALGAQAVHVRWLVINHGLKLLTLGVIAGAGVALVGTRLAKSLLYGVSPSDPTTFAVVLMLIIATGLTAAAIPAMRASREDPAMALRSD